MHLAGDDTEIEADIDEDGADRAAAVLGGDLLECGRAVGLLGSSARMETLRTSVALMSRADQRASDRPVGQRKWICAMTGHDRSRRPERTKDRAVCSAWEAYIDCWELIPTVIQS